MRLKLLVKQRLPNGTATRFLDVQRDHCVLGRKDADLILAEPRCSRHHALFYVDRDGSLRIKDLESTNGTYLNGRRIQDAALRAGDEIRVGQAVIVVVLAEAGSGPSASRPTERWERVTWTQDDTLTLQEAAQQWPAQFFCQPKERQTAFRDYVLGTGVPGKVRQHGGNSHDSHRKQTSSGLGGGSTAVPGVR